MGQAVDFASPKRILEARGLRPRLRFGQHFLVDPRLAASIARAVPRHAYVIEIGGGTGTLTEALAGVARRVDVLEVDRGLAQVLRERFAQEADRLRVIEADALDFDFRCALAAQPPPRAICGNLPYAITTPLLERIVAAAGDFENAILMVQREYGQRLLARPKTANYSSLTVFVGHYCSVEKLAQVGAAGFYPRPKVDSIVVRLTPRRQRLGGVANEPLLLWLIRAAFAQRRKMLVNSVWSQVRSTPAPILSRDSIAAALKSAELAAAVRGEELSLDDFRRLANALARVNRKDG